MAWDRIVAEPIHRVLHQLIMRVLIPVLRSLKPLYEAAAWALCLAFIVQASRYPDHDSRVFICITGIVGSMMTWTYSMRLRPPRDTTCAAFFALIITPLAVAFDSHLIGFLAVGAAYNAMGFLVGSWGLCFLIGFEDDGSLNRCLISSLVLLVGLIGAHAAHLTEMQYLKASTKRVTFSFAHHVHPEQ